MTTVRPETRADAPAWLEMRRALWPGADADHASEVERFFSVGVSAAAHHALGFTETDRIRCFRKLLQESR